jgi:hypothetical protein
MPGDDVNLLTNRWGDVKIVTYATRFAAKGVNFSHYWGKIDKVSHRSQGNSAGSGLPALHTPAGAQV